jgi:hypothetical protein
MRTLEDGRCQEDQRKAFQFKISQKPNSPKQPKTDFSTITKLKDILVYQGEALNTKRPSPSKSKTPNSVSKKSEKRVSSRHWKDGTARKSKKQVTEKIQKNP